MILNIKHVLPEIALNAGGAGLDYKTEPGRTHAFELYNRITRLLLLDGDWEGTEVEMLLEVQNSRIALPYEAESIIWAKLEGNKKVDLRGIAYDFIDAGPGFADLDTGAFDALQAEGPSPTHRDLPFPMHILTWSDRDEEPGTTLHVQGADSEGIAVKTVLGPGLPVPINRGTGAEHIPGYSAGDLFSDGKIATIRSVSKPRTNGRVYVFGFLPDVKRIVWLTTMGPDTISNTVTKYRVAGVPEDSECVVRARVMLRAVPQFHEEDVALVQSQDAYGRMAKALAYFDEGDLNRYTQYKNAALSVLNKQLRRGQRNHKHALNINLTHAPRRIRNGCSR